MEDVFQQAFRAVLTHIGEFRKSRPGDTFRGWLFTITRNKINDHFRRARREPQGEGGTEALDRFSRIPAPERKESRSGMEGATGGSTDHEAASDAGAEQGLFLRGLEIIRGEFQDPTWKAFWLTAVDGRSAPDVAAELRMSAGAVRVAKCRVLRRLREELGDAQ